MGKVVVFIGGAHGVGKTTVIDQLRTWQPLISVYDPGELFWRYSINNKIIENSAVEKMIAASLIGLAGKITLINWHYAIWRPSGYIPQIDWLFWEMVAWRGDFDLIFLVLLKCSNKELLRRRKKDCKSCVKKRKLSLSCIKKELAENRIFFERHKILLKKHGKKVLAVRIYNKNSEEAAKDIIEIMLAKGSKPLLSKV